MLPINQQKRKIFFEIKEKLKEIQDYVDIADAENRFLEVDFWMDDLLFLAKKFRKNNYKIQNFNTPMTKLSWPVFYF